MVRVGNINIGDGSPLVLIAGPCVVEGREITLQTAEYIQKITSKYHVPLIFKASYKKANRTSGVSFMGLEMGEALKILAEVKRDLGIPVLTDIHSELEAAPASEVVDVLQVPAFLSRQTEILQAAGRTGKAVNIKKGQFLAPQDMEHQAHKVTMTGNKNVMLTERGTTFGYHNLVVDMRALSIMRQFGHPVILDATHSVQLPGGAKNHSSGQPEFIFPIARAGVAVGIDGLFVETHPNPERALSDASSQLKLELLEDLIKQVKAIDSLVKEQFAI
ncbi:MAG: 3-deoxy-8-phosphooctulonate synthase [Ignavibacteria bacterium]|nr:3-deoxy-8-phosphooctulonate synthase [Ignavibacteria bacterium]MBI3766688.1 3-deoxy-8-phosphooctulonate synthase [Ignavibacteriales bacterium]